jgi:hypothetical protein
MAAEALAMVTEQALTMSDVDLVALAVPAEGQRLVIVYAAGEGADRVADVMVPVAGSLAGPLVACITQGLTAPLR